MCSFGSTRQLPGVIPRKRRSPKDYARQVVMLSASVSTALWDKSEAPVREDLGVPSLCAGPLAARAQPGGQKTRRGGL